MKKNKLKKVFKKIIVFIFSIFILFGSIKINNKAEVINYNVTNISINYSIDTNTQWFTDYFELYSSLEFANVDYYFDLDSGGGIHSIDFHYKISGKVLLKNNQEYSFNSMRISVFVNYYSNNNLFINQIDFFASNDTSGNYKIWNAPQFEFDDPEFTVKSILYIDFTSYKGSRVKTYSTTWSYHLHKNACTFLDMAFTYPFTYNFSMEREFDYDVNKVYLSPVYTITNNSYGYYKIDGQPYETLKVYIGNYSLSSQLQYNSVASTNMGLYTCYTLNNMLNFTIYTTFDSNASINYNFNDLLIGILNVPIIYLQNLFSFEILGVNFYAIVFSVVMITLILYFVMRIIRGGK